MNETMHKFTLHGVNFIFILLFLTACLDKNYDDVAINDDVSWEPELSLPVGETTLDVNDYFDSPPIPDTSTVVDSFLVYYEDSLYILNIPAIEVIETIEFSTDQIAADPNSIYYLKLKIIIENGYPTNLATQVYFLTNEFAVIDSVFNSRQIIEPAVLNDQGEVLEPKKEIIEVLFEGNEIQDIFSANYLRIYGAVRLSHENLESVQFYQDYDIEVKIGLQTKIDVDPK